MANRHYTIDEEFKVSLDLTVNVLKCSCHQYLKEDEIAEKLEEFKEEITQHLKDKLINFYYREEVTLGVDDWTYEILEK